MLSFLRGLRDLVFPAICHVCSADTADWDPYFCPHCLAELWRPGTRFCDCTDVPFVSWIGFLGPYAGAVKAAVHEVKFSRRRGLARHLGYLLGRRLPQHLEPPHLLVPVPLSAKGLARRGFNQAEEIARGLGEELGSPVAHLLSKRRETRAQRTMPIGERFANVAGSFALRSTSELRNKRVGLVDDVSTTGATLGAAARLLKAAGAREVLAFVVGKTERRL